MQNIEIFFQPMVVLKGSYKRTPDAIRMNTLDREMTAEILVLLRHKNAMPIPSLVTLPSIISRNQYSQQFGTLREDIILLQEFAYHHHLVLSSICESARMIRLKGRIGALEQAFQVKLSHYRDEKDRIFRARTGEIRIPSCLESIIEGVFGLDDRMLAEPQFKVHANHGRIATHTIHPESFYPDQVADLYHYPKNGNGRGQTIAMIALGGGYRVHDLSQYFEQFSVPLPDIRTISVGGAYNNPGNASSVDTELMLELELLGVVAPASTLVVYFAANTEKGFVDAVTTAIHDPLQPPDILLINWGCPEKNWTVQSLKALHDAFQSAALLGITVCAACAAESREAFFPASNPYVLSCGGSRLSVNAAGKITETLWEVAPVPESEIASSDVFARPQYQTQLELSGNPLNGFKGRVMPDLVANAAPETGYRVKVDGLPMVAGGNSTATAMVAGLIARLNELNGGPYGFLHPILYRGDGNFRQIRHTEDQVIKQPSFSSRSDWKPGQGLGVWCGWKHGI